MKKYIAIPLLLLSLSAQAGSLLFYTTGEGHRISANGKNSVDGWSGSWQLKTEDGSRMSVHFKHKAQTGFTPVYTDCVFAGPGLVVCIDDQPNNFGCTVMTTFGYSDSGVLVSQTRSCQAEPSLSSIVHEHGIITGYKLK